MRIIKHGKPEKCDYLPSFVRKLPRENRVFACHNCGCEFEAMNYELMIEPLYLDCKILATTSCPECGHPAIQVEVTPCND